MALNFSELNAEIKARGAKDPLFTRLGLILDQVQEAVNAQGTAIGVDSTGHTSPPDAPNAISVKAAGGMAHVVLTDNNQRNRALHYFVEASTDPSFPDQKTHTEYLGPGRSKFFSLPNQTDGAGAQPWYFRSYSMNLGSNQRSAHQVYGGSASPTPVTVGGSVQLTPLPTTGSGTTQQAGQGFGTSQFAKPS